MIFFYVFTIIAGAFVIVFYSAFQVLSPETKPVGLPLLESGLKISTFRYALEFYSKFLPYSTESFKKMFDTESISLRPGIDGRKAAELTDTPDNEIYDEICAYNAGCIELNEELVEQNRRFLSNIYSTAVVFAFSIFVLSAILIGAVALPT